MALLQLRARLPADEFSWEMLTSDWASLAAQMVKNLPAAQETWGPSLDREDPLEKGMATPPVFLPGRLQSMGWQRVRHD